jgi:hypothetical protein
MHVHPPHSSSPSSEPPSSGPTGRTLLHQLVRASAALDAALDATGDDPAALQEAREALEAFDLLERGATDVLVPREIRRRIREAAHYIDTDHIELARADVGRAGGELERFLQGRPAS